MDIVADVTTAPKKAFSFVSNNLIAAVLLVVLLMVVFVAIEVRNPGQISTKVGKLPLIGPWATRREAA